MTTKMIYRRRLLIETKLINLYKKGERIGYWKCYWINGNLHSKGNYNNDGKPIGYWEGYWNNGNLSSKGKFNNGSAVGDWHYFNKDGSLKEIINYDN